MVIAEFFCNNRIYRYYIVNLTVKDFCCQSTTINVVLIEFKHSMCTKGYDPKNLFITISFGGEGKMKIFHPSFFISPKRSLKVMVNDFPKSVIAKFVGYAD